jgi:hypothetical protein
MKHDDDPLGDPPPPKIGRGRPKHSPNDITRRFVEALAGAGLQQDHIAAVVNIAPSTLRKFYHRELDTALAKNVAQVGQTLLLKAIGGPPPIRHKPNEPAPPDNRWKSADTQSAIYYLKSVGAKFGWGEHYDIKHSGAVGEYDLSKLTDADISKLTQILDSARRVGSPPGRDRKA